MLSKNLKIYDTAEKQKRTFIPLSPKKVTMYCCGPTVYDYLHIGNFRGAVFFNFVRNWLEFLNYKVDYIYNFTDIDDKILNRSQSEKINPQQLAEKYIKEFKKDYKSLKLAPHTANPRATETLPEIIHTIERLIKEKKAYEIDGDVFYSVASFKDYGSLSRRKTKDLLSGARIEVDKRKKNPLDFALWKKTKKGESWYFVSPWGKGRPGWHIECTAMIHKFLGESIDIHAGGADLIFPHHENEKAQSTALTNKKYVQFWMHNNMIVTKGDKMSKSLGNMITMREFLNQYPGELFKFLILSSHYRSPLQFSKKTVRQALTSLLKIYSSLAKAEKLITDSNKNTSFEKDFLQAEEKIQNAFNDDFATPKAFAVFFSLFNRWQKLIEDKKLSLQQKSSFAKKYVSFFKKYGNILALFQEDPHSFLTSLEDKLLEQKQLSRTAIQKQVTERVLARKNKDFKKADQLRKELEKMGIELRDTSQGSEWEIKK